MARKSSHDRDALEAARRKKQEQYWADRAQSRVRANDRNADTVKAEQDKAYRDARDNVRREIDKFYRDFGNAAGMSEEEVRQKLSRGELKDFKAELERKRRIIQEMIKKDPNNKALKRYDREWENLSKVRELTRKEALEANITAEIAQIGGKQQMSMDSHLNKVIDTSLKMNADDLKKLGNVDVKLGVGSPEQVKRAAKENWQHSDFSDRIWDDKEKLIKETREVIENGFAHNKGAMDMATDLMVRMNVSHSNALRVVRTEFNHLSNQAALAEYKSSGIKKYKFVSAIDNRTCSVCHGLNGKEFLVSEAKTGVNFPPIHPNCRSVTVPVIDWGDKDQWDYSNIELDDAELAELGLTREEVNALDASAPELPKDAPKPTLTTREADKAANDTQSVKRRAEQAERIKAQSEALEVDIRKQKESFGAVETKLDQYEDMQQRMDGEPMTEARAAIEAERLEDIALDIRKQELEVIKLQDRVAKLDDTVPKPEPERIDALEAELDEAKTRRADRQKKDLSDAEIVEQALPRITVEKSEPTAEDAIAPKSRAGKVWASVKAEVEKAWKKFNSWIDRFECSLSLTNVGLPAGATIVDLEGKDRIRANLHAKIYYEAVRHKTNDVNRISENTGIQVEEIKRIKDYLFIEEHELEDNGKRRFFPDFMIAQSWQRLESGKNIQPHDLTLLRHEIEERRLVIEEGMTQSEAHREACKKYNYPREAEDYYDSLKKNKKNGNVD